MKCIFNRLQNHKKVFLIIFIKHENSFFWIMLSMQVIKMLMMVVALFTLAWLPLQLYDVLNQIFTEINEYNSTFPCHHIIIISSSYHHHFIIISSSYHHHMISTSSSYLHPRLASASTLRCA